MDFNNNVFYIYIIIMGIIANTLEPTDGYIMSFKRNTVDGWWEAEIGLPKNWVFNNSKNIKCEVLDESDIGKLVKISPQVNTVLIDDLISFIEIIMETNQKIAEKEKQFTDKMDEMKKLLEKEAKQFYEELDKLKENSFNKIGSDNNIIVEEKKETRGRKPKVKEVTTNSSASDVQVEK